MTTVGPVTPPLPPLPAAQTATMTATAAVGTGATPAPSSPTITEAAVQGLTAIVVNLPNTLRNWAAGTQVAGTLVGQDANGLQLLRTADGTITLRGLAGLPVGTPLALTLPEGAGAPGLAAAAEAPVVAQQAATGQPLAPG